MQMVAGASGCIHFRTMAEHPLTAPFLRTVCVPLSFGAGILVFWIGSAVYLFRSYEFISAMA